MSIGKLSKLVVLTSVAANMSQSSKVIDCCELGEYAALCAYGFCYLLIVAGFVTLICFGSVRLENAETYENPHTETLCNVTHRRSEDCDCNWDRRRLRGGNGCDGIQYVDSVSVSEQLTSGHRVTSPMTICFVFHQIYVLCVCCQLLRDPNVSIIDGGLSRAEGMVGE